LGTCGEPHSSVWALALEELARIRSLQPRMREARNALVADEGPSSAARDHPGSTINRVNDKNQQVHCYSPCKELASPRRLNPKDHPGLSGPNKREGSRFKAMGSARHS